MTNLKKFILLLFLLNLTPLAKAQIEQSQLQAVNMELSPQKCVSLREGQDCYAQVTLKWTSSLSDDFCLYSSQSEQPLKCWSNQQSGRYIGEIVANHQVTFVIKIADHEEVLAKNTLEVAWVYKRRRSSMSWRIF